jgi:hypothetical protein
MNSRKSVLLLVFAIAFGAMVVSIIIREGAAGPGPIIFASFGGALGILYWASLRQDWPVGFPRFIRKTWLHSIIGSTAIVGGLWLLTSTILLVAGNMAGCDFMESPWFFVSWLVASAAITPIVARHMKWQRQL